MKKIVLSILCGLILCPLSQSCSDWLDVEYKTEIAMGRMFETEQSVKDVLFGCYTLMSNPKLYGSQLTCTFMEVLGQQYFLPGSQQNSYYNASRYIYTDSHCENIINGIWSDLYTIIANVNALIEGLEIGRENLNPMFYHLTKAEAYSLRAFVYLDLVRLFTWGDLVNRPGKLEEYSIPYAKTYDKDIIPQSKLKDVLKYIHEDLEVAIALFKQYDPVIKGGERPEDYVQPDPADNEYRWDIRKYKMNIKAAVATRMRLNLWEGNYADAYQDAKKLIEGEYLYFTPNLDREDKAKDLTYSSEMLFGLEAFQRFDNIIKTYFEPKNKENKNVNAFVLTEERIKEIFETSGDGASDNRFLYGWKDEGDETYKFLKFWEYEDMQFTNAIPLIRASEIYYTAAECALKEGDRISAIGYINTVRNGRNIPASKNLSANLPQPEVEKELYKEWRKDFIGDGQMFYYYKRNGFVSIPNALADITIDDHVYILPMPQKEMDFGGRIELIDKNE